MRPAVRAPLPLLLTLVACAKAPSVDLSTPADPPPRFAFEDAGLPHHPGANTAVRWAPRWTWGTRSGDVSLALQIGAGDTIGPTLFGIVTTADGRTPFPSPDGDVPWEPGALDHASLQRTPAGWRLWTHVESAPSSLYLTDLDREGATFVPTATRAVDLSRIGGGKDFCAGTITPWGTLLSSEEYDVDLRTLDPSGRVADPVSTYDHAWNRLPEALPHGAPFHPYQHGWVPEFALTPDGSTRATKHLAMGRFSHEIGLVLPDRRTVLLTDDVSRFGGLFLFVADHPEDLSTGTLYGLRWTQTARAHGGAAAVSWVNLGHADPSALQDAWSVGIDDVMAIADPLPDGRCPPQDDGLDTRRVRTVFGTECVAPRPGRAVLASRVETRRYAAWAGATTELTKVEGATFDPLRRRALVALSRLTEGMADGHGAVDIDPNPCGGIYALEGMQDGVADTTGVPIDSPWVPTRMRAILTGEPLADGHCAPEGLSEPDNVTMLPTHDLLVIAEDTGPDRHDVPTLWAHDLGTGALTRLATGPRCSEWSGLHGTVDGDEVWLTVSLQHAWRYKDCVLDEGTKRPPDTPSTSTGILGPFPRGPVDPLDRVRATIGRRITDGIE